MDQKDKVLRDKKALRLFLIISVGISFILEIGYIIFHFVTGKTNSFFMVAIMWTPAIAAFVIALKYYKRISILGVSIGRATPILLGLFLPLIYLGFSFLISWAILGDKTTGFQALALTLGWEEGKGDLPILFILSHVMVGIIPSCVGAFGEELGWRGFMYPIIERSQGRKKAVLYSGLIYSFWYLPLVISGLYETSTVRWYGIIMFIIYIIVFNFILVWLRSVSDSILPPLLVHASSNMFGQLVFAQLSTNSKVPYLAGETGVITIISMIITSAIGWKLWTKHDLKAAEKDIKKA